MTLNLIWAQTRQGVIGVDGHLPWGNLPEDMQHFRDLTRGHTVIMGSKTWASLPDRYRPLPGRRNIVLTRHPERYPDVETHTSLDSALKTVDPAAIAWIIGGGELYENTIDLADELHVTEIDIALPGDTYAPTIIPHMWMTTATTPVPWQTSTSGQQYRFITYHQS